MKRIKHNDLLPWFTQDHNDAACFLYKRAAKNFLTVQASKLQAASRKRQAASNKQKGKNVRNFYNFY
jgi:hypothetical protein